MSDGHTIVLRTEQNRKVALTLIERLNIEQKQLFEITISRHRDRRSLSQNALYWKWINEVADMVAKETGNDAAAIHQHFKEHFLPPQVTEIAGQVSHYYTTTKLTKEQMSEYMNRIYAFATQELGLVLTLPEERFAA